MRFPFFFLSLLLILIATPTLSSHVITFAGPRPSGLAWDRTAQHFVVGSDLSPTVFAISDAGVVEELLSDPSAVGDTSPAVSIAVDVARRRLLVAFARPAVIAAYDLKSVKPYRRIFASPLPDLAAAPGGLAVDQANGVAFVSNSNGGIIWRVDLDGIVSVLSEAKVYGDQGLGAIVHVSWGYLLVVQPSTGKIFKVDEEYGSVKEVLSSGNKPLATAVQSIAAKSDGSAVLAGKRSLQQLISNDGWAHAAVQDNADMAEQEMAVAVAVRDGKRAYALVMPEVIDSQEEGQNGKKRFRIEEVEWPSESEGEMIWGFVLLGLGFAYFLYWRFQMGKLVGSMNKKRA